MSEIKYRSVKRPGTRVNVSEHTLVAEKVLGRRLPAGAAVHHVDGDKRNNKSNNLVICQDAAYHNWLHQRQRAYDACGHADWESCVFCGDYGDPADMLIINTQGQKYHRECRKFYRRLQKIVR